jgi:hypothetical protein
MPDSEKFEYLAGQINALYPFFLALMRTHPHLESLERAWGGGTEYQEANTLPVPVPERFRDGQQHARARIVALLDVAKSWRVGGDG